MKKIVSVTPGEASNGGPREAKRDHRFEEQPLGGRMGEPGPLSPTGGKKHVELTAIHDFASKLCQLEILPRVKEYVQWQVALRGAQADGTILDRIPPVPDRAPVSINLDITTACNYACDHCVDMDILNKPIKYAHDNLLDSIRLMSEKGLKSVIVIGGGEPTVYPRFVESVRFMKELGLQVSVVSNGSGMKKIAELVDCLDENDWIRLSLDSGSDEVFQAMHLPKKPITLDEICQNVLDVRKMGPKFQIGFSFIITWKGAFINDTKIVENKHEIIMGAERARKYGFDYVTYKPFLTRAAENNAEIVDLKDTHDQFEEIIAFIREEVDKAKTLATDTFSVFEATNLKVFENRSYKNYTQQPHQCHMQFFRQVLSPLGLYNCPVYRNQPHGHVGTKEACATEESFEDTRGNVAQLIHSFDAHHECREVTCLYNHVNWWLEEMIAHPELLDQIEATSGGAPDYFL
jgi:hypothetical protein